MKIVLELTMDDERWVQDSLALMIGSTVLGRADEYGVDPAAPAHIMITNPGGDHVRRTSLEDLRHVGE